jgi:clan AA aspartic protease (TIGR02281 family)
VWQSTWVLSPNRTEVSEEVFPVAPPNKVTILPVTINGVQGRFFLDTGASFVFLNNSFAEKAKVEIDESATIKMRTANGIGQGRRGRAEVIQLRSHLAKNVQIVVPAKDKDMPGVDGPLGMSFLSRFNIRIDESSVRLSSRGGAQAEAKPPNIRRPFVASLGLFRVFWLQTGRRLKCP